MTRLSTIVRPGAPWTRLVCASALRIAVGATSDLPKAVGMRAPSATPTIRAKAIALRAAKGRVTTQQARHRGGRRPECIPRLPLGRRGGDRETPALPGSARSRPDGQEGPQGTSEGEGSSEV